MNARSRFWSKVDKRGPVMPGMESQCWVWTAGKYTEGYGKFWDGTRDVGAHVYALNLVAPVKHQALHRCDNRACVRASHLFDGTQAENNRDCVAKGRNPIVARNKARTNCPAGHEYSPENTYTKNGSRFCRACQAQHQRRLRAERKAVAL